MKRGKQALIGVLVIFLVANVAAFSQTKLDWVGTSISRQNSQEMEGTSEPELLIQQRPSARTFSVSNEQLEGTLDPVRVEQSGYYTTENLSARTDTSTNTKANLTIDEENGWCVSQADLDLWNLKRLYVANGTFDDGTSGWYNYTHDSSGENQTQIVSYNDMSEYVTVENRGEKHLILDWWTHYDATEVLWKQNVTNVPYATNFTLNFKFQYASGLLDPIGDDLKDYFWLVIRIDGQTLGLVNLVALESRSIWYEIVPHPVYLPSAPSNFEFEIGLYINSTVLLYATEDYDDDGAPDGVANAAFCEVFLDDVSLVGKESPSFDEVDLKFHAEDYNTSVIGSGGSGNATIVNPSFWTDNPLKVEVTSNTSVSFDYRARILSHRHTNTSWAADPNKPGVLFSAAANQNASLAMYTYVGTFGEYENFTIRIDYPTDWDNPVVYNPFLNDVTGQCFVGTGRITLPTSILDRLGWWQITLKAPNYAKSIAIQKYDEGSGLWDNSTQFRSGNTTRTQVTLGTDVSTPDLNNPVNLTWSLPNASIWSEESLTGGFNGQVNSTSWMLGALNTSAGQWSVVVCWSNGTEVAYGTASFDMYHTATLTPKHTEIQTESGLVVTNFLYYVDADNGEYLMDAVATIEGNWSSSTLTFNPNLLHNWWETDFDTAAVGGGVHLVIANASRPYFDDVSCQFVIEATLLTQFTLFVDSGPPIEVGLNEKHIYEFRYELLDGTGIDDAIIDVSFSPTVGLNVSAPISTASGNYSLEIFGFQSDMYTVTVSANKSYHYVGSDSFMIEVGEFGAILSKENGSADLVSFGDVYRFVVRYANMTGYGLTGATVEIVDMAPSDWIPLGPLFDEGNGYYSILLSPTGAGTFTVVVKANFTNHETQFATFSLTVAAVPSVLVPSASGGTISINQSYTLQLSFEDEFGIGLEGANITVLSPPAGLLFYDAIDLGGGLYNITIEPLVDETTTFEMLFRATLENYQSSTTAFSLLVRTVPTSLDILEGGSSEFILFTEQYTLTLVYIRTDTSENVSSAHLDVFVIPSEGLSWVVRKIGVIYEVTFTAETVGKWQVFLTANKTQYVSAATQFELEVGVMDSSINQITLVEALVYNQAYNFTFTYLMLNGTGITDADVVPSGVGREWFSVAQGSMGQYVVTLIPQRIGSFEVTFSFNADGFDAKNSAFSFSVVEVAVEVANIQGLSGAEDQLTTISLSIVESDTEQPVTGARVVVQVIVDLVRAQSVQLAEVGEGQYSGQFIMPGSDTVAEIRIFVDLENYVLDGEYFQTELRPEMSAFALLTRTVQQYSPLLFLMGALVVGFIVQKMQSRRRKAEYIEALVVKRRFDDVRNLLGVIVLHRSSGIPIYSKLLKEGFDDSMLSGFIAAITQFRSEFEVDQKEWQIIPISDIIRTVSTQNLICAFITFGSPTGTQEEQMIQFARAIAFIFDSHFESAPTNVLDDETEDRFETLFDEMLDGALLIKYRTVEAHKLPRNLRPLKRGTSMMDSHDEFELEELASIMTRSGLEEARVYKTIMDGIEIGYLEPIDFESDTDSQES